LAERLHKTVEELLTGHKQPLSNAEYMDWIAYRKVRAMKEEQAQQQTQLRDQVRSNVRRR